MADFLTAALAFFSTAISSKDHDLGKKGKMQYDYSIQ